MRFIKRKMAGVGNQGAEELAQFKHMVLTREDNRKLIEGLFANSPMAGHNKDKALMQRLFVQAPAAVTMSPQLQPTPPESAFNQGDLSGRTVSTGKLPSGKPFRKLSHVREFFDSGSHLTDAQKNFPELLNAGEDD